MHLYKVYYVLPGSINKVREIMVVAPSMEAAQFSAELKLDAYEAEIVGIDYVITT